MRHGARPAGRNSREPARHVLVGAWVQVVAADKAPRPARRVKLKESRAAATLAEDGFVGLAGLAQALLCLAVFPHVVRAGRHDNQVLGAVVVFYAVSMVNLLAGLQWATDRSLGNEAVFVHVATRVCRRV